MRVFVLVLVTNGVSVEQLFDVHCEEVHCELRENKEYNVRWLYCCQKVLVEHKGLVVLKDLFKHIELFIGDDFVGGRARKQVVFVKGKELEAGLYLELGFSHLEQFVTGYQTQATLVRRNGNAEDFGGVLYCHVVFDLEVP